MSADAIPASVRERVGVETRREVLVRADDIRRFAQAIGAPDADDGVAPPLFCQALTYADVPREQLGPDGAPAEITLLDLPAQRAVGGSSDYRINRRVRAGETITVVSRLADVYAKEGRSGPLYMVVVETDFRDADDALVASETATYIKRP
jgi:3-methylfumaryl-CoA hydratase